MDIVPEINEYVANVKKQLDEYIKTKLASYRVSMLDGLEETYTDRFGELIPDTDTCINSYLSRHKGQYYWIIHYMYRTDYYTDCYNNRNSYSKKYAIDNYGNILELPECKTVCHCSPHATLRESVVPPGTNWNGINRTIPLSDKQITYIKNCELNIDYRVLQSIVIQSIVKDHFELQQKCMEQSKRVAELEAELSTFKRAPIGNLLDICEVELLMPKRAPICEDATKELDYVV